LENPVLRRLRQQLAEVPGAGVICVFPDPHNVPALKKGKTYRFEGTYRGRRGAGGAHEVLLLTECEEVQLP
jgi:hypothetical protein